MIIHQKQALPRQPTFCILRCVFACGQNSGVYTPKMLIHQKPKTPVLVYTPQKCLYTRNQVFIYTRNTYTPEKHQKKNLWDAGMFRGGGGPGAWVLGLLVVGRSGRIMSAITDGVPS